MSSPNVNDNPSRVESNHINYSQDSAGNLTGEGELTVEGKKYLISIDLGNQTKELTRDIETHFEKKYNCINHKSNDILNEGKSFHVSRLNEHVTENIYRR